MNSKPPRLALRLLRSILPTTVSGASTLGDLTEEYHRRTPSLRRRLWFWAVALEIVWQYAPSRFAGLAGGFGRDLVYTMRMVRRSPSTLVTALVSLSLAIGLGTAAFTVANGTWLRRQLAVNPAIVKVWRVQGSGASMSWPMGEFLELRRLATRATLEAWWVESFHLTTDRVDEIVTAQFVTTGYLSMIDPRVAAGRLLAPSDDQPGAPPVVVLSHEFWRRAFGGDRSTIGRTISLSNVQTTVVGIAGRDFVDPGGRHPAMWLPVGAREQLFGGPLPSVYLMGRLKNLTQQQAAVDELTGLVRRLGAVGGTGVRPATGADAAPVQDPEVIASTRQALLGVMAVIAIVLVLACANVSNLHLARAASRRQEIAVRLSCGASRPRIVRQLMTESVLLAAVAGGLGFVAARAIAPALALGLGMPGADLDPDARVYIFGVLIATLAAIGSGLAPALYAVRDDVAASLKGTPPRDGPRARSTRARSAFVGIQAASSVVLVAMAALFVRALVHIAWLDPGFDVDHLITVSVTSRSFIESTTAQTPRAPAADLESAAKDFWSAAATRVRSIPGVEHVSIAEMPPFAVTLADPEKWYSNATDADYFATLGLRVLRGRTYTAAEVESHARVLVLSEQMARQFWGIDDPIGAMASRISKGASAYQVIGVVADALMVRVHDRRTPVMYMPLSSYARVQMAVAAPEPSGAVTPIRDALRSVAPSVRSSVSVVGDRFAREFQRPRQYAALATSVASFALGLSVVGLLGVTTLMVRTRTREIGLRMALGAKARDVIRLLLTDGLRPVAIGLVAGLVAALMAGQFMAGLLYGLSPRDPMALGAAIAILFGTALTAVLVPTRRAARLDPAKVLREG